MEFSEVFFKILINIIIYVHLCVHMYMYMYLNTSPFSPFISEPHCTWTMSLALREAP